MIIGDIAGFAFLPVSIMMFLDIFGITKMTSLFGIDLALLAAIGIIIVEIGDLIDAHLKGSFVILAWIVCLVLIIPSILFFISKFAALPAAVASNLPVIMASFLFVEGFSSFFIGGD